MRKKRVWIADDDEAFLAALAIRLREEGYDVSVASDGYQALALAATEPVDLMILDIRMPCGDGFSVLERLKKLAKMPVPVIYVTGQASSDVAATCHRLGATALFSKPLDRIKFMRAVRAALSVRKPSPGDKYLSRSI